EVRRNPGNFQREEIFGATDEHAAAMARRMTMEGQLNSLQSKRTLIDRSGQILAAAQRQLSEYTAPQLPPDTAPLIDESRLLQAVVDTQEEERKRIARQVHDGPAQAMANVVLQSEISERLFDVDAQKSRGELASLRQMVNKALQELRGSIFELPPDGELQSGIRRSERLELLHGDSTHEARADGTVVLKVKIPIRSAPQLVS